VKIKYKKTQKKRKKSEKDEMLKNGIKKTNKTT